MKTKNNKYRLILLTLLNLAIIIVQPMKLKGQSQIFIAANEIKGFDLEIQSKKSWYGPDKQLRTFEEQQWKTYDSKDKQYVYIQYYLFNSIPEAISGTARLSQRFSVPYTWGSPTGYLVGNETWSLLNTDFSNSSALFFVKGNIGIQVFVHGMDKVKLIKTVTDKLVTKIERYLQQNDTIEKRSNLIDSLVYKNLSLGFNYTNNISNLSHWVIDSTQYKSGLREEWSNDNFTIGLDACLFNNAKEANTAAKMKSKICSISKHIYDFHDQNYASFVKSEWELYLSTEISNRTFSFVGIKDNIAFHFYCFNIGKDDFETINFVISQLAKK